MDGASTVGLPQKEDYHTLIYRRMVGATKRGFAEVNPKQRSTSAMYRMTTQREVTKHR
jgi:hypothetical protein